MTALTRTERSGKSAVVINGVLGVALLVTLAAVALVAKPPAPPGIAEFAPQAAKPIVQAPLSQTSRFGNTPGAATGTPAQTSTTLRARLSGLPVPSTLPTTPLIGVPSSLQCYSWPDGAVTQTFDPQSPPCVANWPTAAEGNGGTTTRGVDATSIRIAVANPYQLASDQSLVAFFNSHFEFYGRQLQLVSYSSASDTGTVTGEQAEAADANATHPFAATGLDGDQYDTSAFSDYLAGDKIVTTIGEASDMTSQHLASRQPYEWSYGPSLDTIEQNLGQFICTSLPAHHNASYAGGGLAGMPRKFAILYPQETDGILPPELTQLVDALATCGVTAKQVQYAQSDSNTDPTNDAIMAQLEAEHVTTMIAFGTSYQLSIASGSNPMPAATEENYQPEWILPGGPTTDDNPQQWALGDETQVAHMFGVATWNKDLSVADAPWNEAYAAASGQQAANPNVVDAAFYHQLLILASGIQAAGPDLTPQTFAAALNGLSFPDPGAGAAPSYQATVGFSATKPSMVQDFGVWSYNGLATSSVDNEPGAFCETESGRRWLLGQWPSGPLPLFSVSTSC